MKWISKKNHKFQFSFEYADKKLTMKELFPVILKVLADFRVIGTVVVMLFVIEFTKFVTTYKKRPPRPKKEKAPKAAPAPKKEEAPAEDDGSEAAEE